MSENISDFLSLRCGESPEFMKDLFREIFKAGVDYGEDKAVSEDWNSTPFYSKEAQVALNIYDNLKDNFEYNDIYNFAKELGL